MNDCMKKSFLRHREKTPAVPVGASPALAAAGAARCGGAGLGQRRAFPAAPGERQQPGLSVPVTAATERSPSGHRAQLRLLQPRRDTIAASRQGDSGGVTSAG